MESVLINGRAYDFTSAKLYVFGMKIVGFTSVDYGDKVERAEVRGASQVPLGTTRGKYSCDPCKITLLKSSSNELRSFLAIQAGPRAMSDIKGTIVLQFIDASMGVQTVTLKDCQVNVPGTSSSKEGTEALTEDWEFYVRLIDRGGMTLYSKLEAGAL